MRTLYLCGATNPEGVRLALRVNDARRRWDRIVLVDDDPARHGEIVLGVEVAGSFDVLESADPETSEVVNLVARTTAKRLAARTRIEAYGLPFAGLIHPTIDVEGAELAADAIVYQNAVVGAQASIDDSSVVFMGAVVGHGSRVGRCCVVAPNAVINARVMMGDGVYVGTNASILPDVTVGDDATIAAGTAVMTNVPAGATLIGVPGKVLPKPAALRPSPAPPADRAVEVGAAR